MHHQKLPNMRDLDPAVALSTTPVLRRKGMGTRTWLLLDSTGHTQEVEAGKYAIMRRTGLPAGDLRILDPFLSYPSTVLGRERAIVVNLEHIKAIIMAKEVLLLNSKDPFVRPFVQELHRRLLCHYQATKAQEGNGDESNWTSLTPQRFLRDERSNAQGKDVLKNLDGSKVLPFEFVALEACLEAACSSLENEAKTLELEANPAIDKLTSQVSTLNLERVRQIKSRLAAITGRVQKMRDELEHLLDDDEDMAGMYLTEKLFEEHPENSSTSSTNEADEGLNDEDTDMDDRVVPPEILLEIRGASTSNEGGIQNDDNSQDHFHGTRSSATRSATIKHPNVGEIEMLLEAYFVQIDGTLNRLSMMREYVADTEDYINIMLDDKQNRLLQMGVMLTTATLVLSFFIVVAGIFGINIKIHLFKIDVQEGMPKWLWATGGGTAGIITLYLIAIAWYKYKGYID